jgi:glycosyltransferase involved in cell wall biosynthesis
MTALAIACALLAACFLAVGVRLQHGSVRAVNSGDTFGIGTFTSVARRPAWLGGTALVVAGAALHLIALSLAPLAIVQPIGVLSLVLTVLIGNPERSPRVVAAVAVVCAGVSGFVLLSTSAANGVPVPPLAAGQPAVLIGAVVAVVAHCVRGKARYLAESAAAAVLFGLGAAIMRVAMMHVLGTTPVSGFILLAEAAALLLIGGWLMHRSYATGPAAVAVAAATVLDPITAVTTSALFFGEGLTTSAAVTAIQTGLALVAIAGVVVLARSVPDERTVKEKPVSVARPSSGLRVLIGADTFPPDINGAANFAHRLARGLASRGHDIHILTPERDDAVVLGEPYTLHHVGSHRVPFHPTLRVSTPGLARRVANDLLDRIRPDIVHVQSHLSIGRGLIAAARRRGIPTVATNHLMPENLLGHVGLPRPITSALTGWAWRDFVRVFGRADVVTTPTKRAARFIDGRGLPGRPVVVSCGIDLAHYEPDADQVPDDVVRALFVGRLDPEKNVDQLVRALIHAADVHADIVGDGSCRAQLHDLAHEIGVADRVTFHGVVTDAELVHAYRSSHVFCMPGTAELQSIATLEAMAAGLPVVAADAMALPHLVRPGRNGYLYRPGNAPELGTYLSILADNPDRRTAMGAAGRRIAAEHSITRTLDTFERIYCTIAGPAAAALAEACSTPGHVRVPAMKYAS